MARHRAHAEGLSFSGDLDAIRVLRKNGMSIAPKPSKADRFPQIVSQEEIDAAEARDRRKKVRGAVARIAAFVAAPTAAAAAYFLHFATPMYSTYSEFVIQRPDSLQQAMTGPGAAMAGAALSGGQDAISVQGYLTSRAAFNELDALEGFVSHFSSEEIDLLQRIPAGADREAQYRTYERRVKVGFDPTEGIVRMQVQAADPETSRDMSLQLDRARRDPSR